MIRGGKMRDKFIVDVDLPDAGGNMVKLRTYYEPLTCEIIHGCTFFSVEGVWQEAKQPDWYLWQKEVWQHIMRSRQGSVCMSMGHCPTHCPNDQHKKNKEYDHKYYDQEDSHKPTQDPPQR